MMMTRSLIVSTVLTIVAPGGCLVEVDDLQEDTWRAGGETGPLDEEFGDPADIGVCEFDFTPDDVDHWRPLHCDGETENLAFLECPRNSMGILQEVAVPGETQADAGLACAKFMQTSNQPYKGNTEHDIECPECPKGSEGCAVSLMPVHETWLRKDKEGQWHCGCYRQGHNGKPSRYLAVKYKCGRCRASECDE